MKILNEFIKIEGVSLILGFFDGIHYGHREVINSAVNYAQKNNSKTVLLTFKTSPAEFFSKKHSYIFSREYSYKLIEELGVDYLIELDFKDIVNISAKEFLEKIIDNFKPISISTGFNYTFGLNRVGNSEYLEKNSSKFGYRYFCIPPVEIQNQVISSTLIKEKISKGEIEDLKDFLSNNFIINSEVISGEKIGRELGYPTANLRYPENITKLPYGVYKVKALGRNAIMNWGVKPTFDGNSELLEVHIFDFNDEIYGKNIEIEVLKKIRAEKKFNSKEDLIAQIKEDIKVCLELWL